MDKRYEFFCIADRLFYDSPSGSRTSKRSFAAAGRPLPAGWTRISLGDWQVRMPPGDPIPDQGWKIHVSAGQDNAERVLGKIFDYCVPRRISFKFLHGPLALHLRNAKYAPRGASGKLAAIYPMDDASCERILAEMDSALSGEHGPYILSDLRYAKGPLYVRYGSFAQRHCRNSAGELVPAITDGTGQLVPDLRTPVFTVPDWLTLPGFLVPHLAARNAVTIKDLPYQVDRALHFSNGGGVYAGTDRRTGDRVVLKEARPYAGLAADGADAVTRLRREHDILRVAAIVEPLRDDLIRIIVTGALGEATRGTGRKDTGAVARITHQAEIVRDSFAGVLTVGLTFAFTTISALVGLATLVPAVLLFTVVPMLYRWGCSAACCRPSPPGSAGRSSARSG